MQLIQHVQRVNPNSNILQNLENDILDLQTQKCTCNIDLTKKGGN